MMSISLFELNASFILISFVYYESVMNIYYVLVVISLCYRLITHLADCDFGFILWLVLISYVLCHRRS